MTSKLFIAGKWNRSCWPYVLTPNIRLLRHALELAGGVLEATEIDNRAMAHLTQMEFTNTLTQLIGSWEWLSKHYKISQGSRSSGWSLQRRRDEEAKGPLEAYTTRICLPNLCKQEEHFGGCKDEQRRVEELACGRKAPLEKAEGRRSHEPEEEDKEALQVLKKENIVACSADNSQEIYYDQREDGDKNIVTCSTVFPCVDNMVGFVLLPIQPEEHFGGCEDERRRVEELVCGTKGSLRKGGYMEGYRRLKVEEAMREEKRIKKLSEFSKKRKPTMSLRKLKDPLKT
ncbi:unnamed protein product [Arabidopsis lyrata]|nr:unnamed protein product [Arabidopsis lyrata]